MSSLSRFIVCEASFFFSLESQTFSACTRFPVLLSNLFFIDLKKSKKTIVRDRPILSSYHLTLSSAYPYHVASNFGRHVGKLIDPRLSDQGQQMLIFIYVTPTKKVYNPSLSKVFE